MHSLVFIQCCSTSENESKAMGISSEACKQQFSISSIYAMTNDKVMYNATTHQNLLHPCKLAICIYLHIVALQMHGCKRRSHRLMS